MSDQKEVKISKMEIQLTDDKISLSMDEAKKLYEALAQLFGSKTVEHVYHDWYYKPYRWSEPRFSEPYALGLDRKLCTEDNSAKFQAREAEAVLMCNLNK